MNLCFLLTALFALGETPEYKSISDLMRARERSDNPVVYINEPFGYRVLVPAWANVQDTGNENIFGALMPMLAGARNAVAVKATPKDQFTSFAEFRKFVFEDNQPGKPFTMNEHLTFKEGEVLAPVTDTRATYRIVIENRGIAYHCKLVLMASEKAWLLVDFFATKETYAQNLERFDAFAKGVAVQ